MSSAGKVRPLCQARDSHSPVSQGNRLSLEMENMEDFVMLENPLCNIYGIDDFPPDGSKSLCLDPSGQVSKTVHGIDNRSDCFISHIEYNIKKKHMKYVLSPDLDYTDSDFEEDSKHIQFEEEDDCCFVSVPDKESEEEEQVTSTVDDGIESNGNFTSCSAVSCDNNCNCSPMTDIETDWKELSSKNSPRCIKQEEVMSSDDTLFQRYVTRGGKKCLVCEVCERIFKHRQNLMKHMQIHTGVKMKYKCSTCTETFDRLYQLEDHQKVHLETKPLKGVVSRKSSRLFSKCYEKKPPRERRETRVRCPMCGVWGTSHAVALHTANHLAGRFFICRICFEGYYSSSQLNHHMKTHLDKHCSKRPNSEDTCVSRSKSKQNTTCLYKCSICDIAFAESEDLKSHVTNHAYKTPFKCNICNKSFVCLGKLKSHGAVHSF